MKLPSILLRLFLLLSHPRYLYNRLRTIFFFWANPDLPWLTQPSIKIIEEFTRKDGIYFEWGSGRSTIWFAKRVSRVISVEHNESWYQKISKKLEASRLLNVEYHLIKVPSSEKYQGEPVFNRYDDFILNFSDNLFDIILIDGKNRNACIRNSILKLKPGGYLVLDNADRGYDVSMIKHWECIETSNGVWKTFFWRKPLKINF